MTDAEFEEQKARIQVLADKWIKPIGLGWWRVTVRYQRDRLESDSLTSNFETKMQCEANWKYGLACITVFAPAIADMDDDALEMMFTHELMHIFLAEMRVASEDEIGQQRAHEERVATTLAKGFMWMRDALTCDREHIGEQAVQEVEY